MINNDKNLSAWLPPRSEEFSSDDLDLNSLVQALRWLGAEDVQGGGNQVIEKPPIPATIATKQEFHETIFRVFNGELKRVPPPIQSKRMTKVCWIFWEEVLQFKDPLIIVNH